MVVGSTFPKNSRLFFLFMALTTVFLVLIPLNKLGLAEHKHIMEVGLTLSAQSHLPPSFWADAFLTSIFIINWLPTLILDNHTPFSKLFGSPNCILRTFGCAYVTPFSTLDLLG